MRKKLKSFIIATTVLVVAMLLFIGFFIPLPVSRVCIKAIHLPSGVVNTKNRVKKIILPKKAKNSFVISYTHSVNKGRVYDYYKTLENGFLLLEKTRFKSYGAGMPEPGDRPGQKFIETDNYIEMQNINHSMKNVLLAIGVIADHAVEFDGSKFPLNAYFIPQTRVLIEYSRVTVYDLLNELR